MEFPNTIPTLKDRCSPSVFIKTCNDPNNAAAMCLQNETGLWNSIAHNPKFALLRLPVRYRLLPNPPFDLMPQDAVRLNVQNGLPISSIAAGQHFPVLTYTVPAGFDGVINVTLNTFTIQNGPGLQDGSGMLTWSIGINNYLQINYTNITMTMGGQAQLGPVTRGGGIRIKANDTITFYCIATVAGLAYLDPNGIILCAIQGWLYPNR